MFQLDRLPVRKILFRRPSGEFAEQRRVGFRRVIRLPALVAQVLQKIFDQNVHGARSKEKEASQPGVRRLLNELINPCVKALTSMAKACSF